QSDGYFIWDPLPDFPSANAKIRITNVEDGYPSDASDSVFTVSPEDALTLAAPNGGEQWQSGSSQYIRWNSVKQNKIVPGGKKTGIKINDKIAKVNLQVSSVKLEYTTNSGASWIQIATDVPNNGSYTWSSVPSANSS
ncbi:hypothetical protein, partial [Bradyrhizobium sp. IC4060]|uniref:hypothetical protein n=1 Tax=Bradyrhizobium sp. IC4060 TaxID=2793807 RepID=UPI001CD56349